MSLDPSQLTLPQIAAAVADGSLPLRDAEAELRRRPQGTVPRMGRSVAPPRPAAAQPRSTEILRALDETRKEVHQATRLLEKLARRLASLERSTAADSEEARRAAIAARRRHRAATAANQAAEPESPSDELPLYGAAPANDFVAA